MFSNSLWRFLFFVLLLYGAWYQWSNRPISVPAGKIVPFTPKQTQLFSPATYRVGPYKINALANFSIEARVLSKEVYRFDRESDLSPVDLALGWGPMSDTAVLEKLYISQAKRFYFYSWKDTPPIPQEEIILHSSNMHLIPTSEQIKDRMLSARPGQVVYIRGQLIEATTSEGWYWRSSLTREDSGAGACEIIRVEEFEIRT